MKMVCPLFTIRGSASNHLVFPSPPLCFPFATYLTLQASHPSSIPSICPHFPLSSFSLHAQLLHLSHHPDPTLPWVCRPIPCLFSSVFMTPLSSSQQLPYLHDTPPPVSMTFTLSLWHVSNRLHNTLHHHHLHFHSPMPPSCLVIAWWQWHAAKVAERLA